MHLYLGVQFHKWGHHCLMIKFNGHSYFSAPTPSYFYGKWIHPSLQWCPSPLWLIWNLYSRHTCTFRLCRGVVQLLGRVIFRIFVKDLELLCGVTGVMQQACFITSRLIYWISCIIFLALPVETLLGVDCKGGFSSLLFNDVAITVGICPVGCLRSCYPFVDLFRDFHFIEHIIDLLAVLDL